MKRIICLGIGLAATLTACSSTQPAATQTVFTTPPVTDATASASSATPSPSSASPSTATPSPTPAGTQQHVVYPFAADGTLAAGYSLTDVKGSASTSCGDPSPAAQGPHTLACSPLAAAAGTCWQSPIPGDSPLDVVCITSPWDTQLRRMRVGSVSDTPAPKAPTGLGIELVDGSRWAQAFGDRWQMMPDGYSGFMNCVSGCAQDEALMTKSGKGIDQSGPQWTVYRATRGDAQTSPVAQQVKQVWFLGPGQPVTAAPKLSQWRPGRPASTPAEIDALAVGDGFKAFLKSEIAAGTKGGCAPTFEISAYRTDGYAVGNGRTTCTMSGEAVYWAKKNGQWMTVGRTQAQLPCADLEAVKFPSGMGPIACMRGETPETYDQP